MKIQLLTFVAVIGVCQGQDLNKTLVKGEVVINGVTEQIPPVTEVTPQPPPTKEPTGKTTSSPTTKSSTPLPSSTTTAAPTTATTAAPITTSTTPNQTTSSSTTSSSSTSTTTTSSTTERTSAATTVLPITVSPAPANNKQFDGLSFIGGIILASGLTAIGFIAFKFYKARRNELNYHTL